MKYHFGFLSALILSLGVFGYLALTLNERDLFYFNTTHDDAGKFLETFRDTHKALAEINFTELYGGSGQFQVLHPIFEVQPLRLNVGGPSCGGEQNVRAWLGENFSLTFKNKREELQRFFYQDGKLPENFLTTPPFVDISGYSYAYFLTQRDIAPYNRKSWIEDHLSFFRSSELAELLKKYDIKNPEYALIARLSEPELNDVVKGEPAVMTKDFLLIKNQSRFGFSPLSYWFFDLHELSTALKGTQYNLVPAGADAICIQRIGGLCWTYSSQHILGYLYRYSIAVLIGLGLLSLASLGLYIKYLMEKNREQKRHRLSLQVLSHEFRTPVATLLLLLEDLRARDMNADDQELVARMSGEIFRLQRLIEVSKTYLRTDSRRIEFNNVLIPSINEWIEDFINENHLNIKCESLAEDRGISADPFWLKFVLSNLVNNALNHGKEPVTIRLSTHSGRLRITVEDQGECEYPFVKSVSSRGMGLGLNMVKFIVEEWGSEIQFSKAPTSFTLTLGT